MFIDSGNAVPDGAAVPANGGAGALGLGSTVTSESVVLEHVEFRNLIPRDVASVTVSWITNYVAYRDTTQVSDVRVRASSDGGATFDAGITVAAGPGSTQWTADVAHLGSPVLRVEFLDLEGKVIGYDDLTGDIQVIRPFMNASAQSGITIPAGLLPYASAPLDYNGDGAEDLVVSYEDRFVQLYRNQGAAGDLATFNERRALDLGDVGDTEA